jgi:hypothetical protein
MENLESQGCHMPTSFTASQNQSFLIYSSTLVCKLTDTVMAWLPKRCIRCHGRRTLVSGLVAEIVTVGLKYSCGQKGFAQEEWAGCRWASRTEAEVPASSAINERDLMLTGDGDR